MTQIKAIRNYVKSYEDETVSPRHRCPLTEQEYLDYYTAAYEKRYHTFDMPYDEQRAARIEIKNQAYKEASLERKVARSIDLEARCICTPYFYLLYRSLPQENWEAVNDAQYQYARQLLVGQCAAGFYYDPRPVLEALAANDFEVLDCNSPDAFGEHLWLPWAASGNLLLGLYHHDGPTVEKGLAEGQRVLAQKNFSKWDKAYIGYFLALARHDLPEASRCLNEVCAGYGRLSNLLPVQKAFCSLGHGMYNYARRILAPEEFDRLEMPTHASFIREFAAWQQAQGCPCGRIAFVYPDRPFRLMNELLQLPATVLQNVPPKMRERLDAMSRKEKCGDGYSIGRIADGWPEKEEFVGRTWIERFGQNLPLEILLDK